MTDWTLVWRDVAAQLGEHRKAGRSHLLTEDTVRLCTVLALERAGVSPDQLTVEVADPALQGGKLDLVVGEAPTRTVLELKYPRGSRTGISPDTMTLGELLRDFLRVAAVSAADRWVLAVLGPQLRQYLARLSTLQWVGSAGRDMVLARDSLEALPKTARDAIGPVAWHLPVRARCEVAVPVDVDLALFAYRVEAPTADSVAAPLAGATTKPPSTGTAGTTPPGKRAGTARAEILEAIHTLITRSGDDGVSVQDVVNEMRRRGSAYAESTVRTMMTSHMCAQVQGPNIGSYDDLERVDRGRYRLRSNESKRDYSTDA